MTEPQSSAAPESETPDKSAAAEAVRSAIESGQDISARVHELVVDVFRGRVGASAAARNAIQGMMQSAADIVDRSAPVDRARILREIIDGVAGGVKSVAQSASYAIQEAGSRGQRFAGEDLERARTDLNSMTAILTESVSNFTNRLSSETGATVGDLKTHAERTISAVIPVIQSSIEAIAKQPAAAAGEAASTAIRGGQLAAGALLSAMSGLLSGAADLLDPDRRGAADSSKPTSPSGAGDSSGRSS